MPRTNGRRCPRCGDPLFDAFPATSRYDSKTEICRACGLDEAFLAMGLHIVPTINVLPSWPDQPREEAENAS